MSIESWEEEFYPVPAEKIKSTKQAIKHAILKFTGALPKNLAKHKLHLAAAVLTDVSRVDFDFDSNSCALCCMRHPAAGCTGCPLFDKYACDAESSPYLRFRDTCDPKPMLRALRAVLKGQP